MPPPLDIPPDLRALFARHGEGALEAAQRFLAARPRPCVYVTSHRVGDAPLARTAVGRLFGLRTAPAKLPVMQSKLGGTTYVEPADLPWDGHTFIGQINFAEIEGPPAGMPREGILALDLDQTYAKGSHESFRVRWYPVPDAQRAAAIAIPSLGRYEAGLRFRAGWSLDGRGWDAVVPAGDEELWSAWNEWEPAGYDEDSRDECHRSFGHPSPGIDDSFVAPEGRAKNVDEYELLWRVTFDHRADFGWGTNWVYVLVHRDDLRDGRLERAIVIVAGG